MIRIARSERGLALPMALGMMMVLAIALAAVLTLSVGGESAARRQNADQQALALAEAGINQAASILVAATDPSVPSALGSGSTNMEGGTSAYSATLSGLRWTVVGTGTVPNPTATGGPVQRTGSMQFDISVANTPWEYSFADQPAGCMTIRNDAVFATPLWINGDLCLANNALYTASKLYVGGKVTNGGSIGTVGLPISSATIVGGCTGGVPDPHPCTAADSVYASSISQTPSALTKPPADFGLWYSAAKPGPANACTSGTMPGGFDNDTTRNRSRPTFDLTPGSFYDCRYVDGAGNTVGQITWTPGSPGTLTVAGTIYFDGDITHSGSAVYAGRATIYASGKVTFTNNSTLCGISGCSSSWDTSNNVLMLVAGSTTDTNGVLFSNNAVFQGAVYAVNNVYIDNNAALWGPAVARSIYVDNNAAQHKALIRLTPGAPGVSLTVQPTPGTWRG
ncbi:MAG: hypothetical protein ABR583_04820 [Gaiellaceae bacterium]